MRRTITQLLLSLSILGCATNKSENQVEAPLCGEVLEMTKVEMCNIPADLLNDIELAKKAAELCGLGLHFTSKKMDNALTLLRTEREMEIPASMRGMTLAAACIESGFNNEAEGDHSFSKDGHSPMAIGILQLWPCYEKTYNADRLDTNSSARAWLKNIKKQIKNVKKVCGVTDEVEIWKASWVHGVRAPKKGGRCNEVVKHWQLFRKIKNFASTQT